MGRHHSRGCCACPEGERQGGRHAGQERDVFRIRRCQASPGDRKDSGLEVLKLERRCRDFSELSLQGGAFSVPSELNVGDLVALLIHREDGRPLFRAFAVVTRFLPVPSLPAGERGWPSLNSFRRAANEAARERRVSPRRTRWHAFGVLPRSRPKRPGAPSHRRGPPPRTRPLRRLPSLPSRRSGSPNSSARRPPPRRRPMRNVLRPDMPPRDPRIAPCHRNRRAPTRSRSRPLRRRRRPVLG
jgi:hypothetical protein